MPKRVAAFFLGSFQTPDAFIERKRQLSIPPEDWATRLDGDDDDNIIKLTEILEDCGHEEIARFVHDLFQEELHSRFKNDAERNAYLDAELKRVFAPCKPGGRLYYLVLALLADTLIYAWELSPSHKPIHTAVDAIVRYFNTNFQLIEPQHQTLVNCFLTYFMANACGMRMENALNINSAPGLLEHTKKALEALDPSNDGRLAQELLDASAKNWEEARLCKWLAKRIWNDIIYFRAVNAAAKIFDHWRRDRQNPATWYPAMSEWAMRVDRVNKYMAVVETELQKTNPWLASELRPHRESLQKLLDYGHVLHYTADDFVFTYCFPFLIKDFDKHKSKLFSSNTQSIETIKAHWDTIPSTGPRPQQFKRAELTDVWSSGPDIKENSCNRPASESNLYKVLTFIFSDIAIRDAKDSDRSIKLTCELRISSFGNHYVRMSCSRNDFDGFDHITASDIYRALRRVSSLAGDEFISVAEGARISEDGFEERPLYKVAENILEGFSETLVKTWGKPDPLYHDLGKTSSVICSMRKMSCAGDPNFVLTADSKSSPLGRLFLNSVGGPADRLEPWLSRDDYFSNPRYDKQRQENSITADLVENALVYKTSNTTLVSLPGCPNFVCLDYEEMAEFVAGLELLYIYWNKEVEECLDDAVASLDNRKRRLCEGNMENLYRKIVAVKKKINEIHSSSLVTNSFYRTFLDRLIAASAIRSLEQDLDKLMITAQELHKVAADKERSESNHRSATRQTIIAVLALFIALVQIGEIIGNHWTDLKSLFTH